MASRKPEALREEYRQIMRECPDDPMIIETCSAGIALVDAEAALLAAPKGAKRQAARHTVEAAEQRMYAMMGQLKARCSNDELERLQSWKTPDAKPH